MDLLDIVIAKQLSGGGGGSGTDNYNDLSNLPKINDTTLSGNKSSSALGLQSEINSDSKLASDLVDDTNQDNKFVTSTEKNTWNAKQNAIDADHKLSSDLVDDANKTNKFVTSTEKNTWNAKQNAIDADHKLSSSLVSFSTAEAAALASGIDSSKVGQISTNQTNILYGLNTGVKNILIFNPNEVFSGDTATMNGVTCKYNGDGTYTLNGTATANTTFAIYLIKSDENKGNLFANCVLLGGLTDAEIAVELYDTPWTRYSTSTNDIPSTINTIPANVKVCVFIRAFSGKSFSNQIMRPMICTRNAYAQSHDFMPPALPNYDLTRLEAEDRASLAEVVDGGAKNLLQNKAESKTQNNVTFTVNSIGEVSVSTAGAASAKTTLSLTNAYIPNTFKGNIISGVPASTTSNTICMYVAYSNNGSSEAKAIYVNAASNPVHEILDYPYIQIFVLIYSGVTVSTALKFQPMICTKAAFGVSQKFVPYRMSYQDLCDKKDAALSTTSKTSGSLDDIAENSFYFVSDGTTGRPVSEYGFVKTSVYSSSVMLQEFTSFSGNAANSGLVFVRVKQAGTWQSWKQLTNA